MNELLLSLVLSLHAGPLRIDALGTAEQNPGVMPSAYAGRLTLELPTGLVRPYLSTTATHRQGSDDFADVSLQAGLTMGDDRTRLIAGWVGTDLEETFGPSTDGGPRGAPMVTLMLGLP